MTVKKRMTIWLGALLILMALGIAGAYRYIASGGMIARQKPPAIEVVAARWPLDLSVPRQMKELKNPLSAPVTSVDVLAGGNCTSKNAKSAMLTTAKENI